ncbi:MAG: hypothetical protein J5700_03160 [Treponema sp.]|nr:hypothetical protein [Treponema sp.]
MKKFNDLKNGFNLAALFFATALVAALGFISCDNVSGGGSDYASQSASSQTASAPTATSASGEKAYVTFNGSVGVDGALPQEVSANLAALEESVAGGDSAALQGVSKSAEPSLNVNGTDYYYYVIATPQDSAKSPITYGKEQASQFKPGSNGMCFAITLEVGKWKIECGIKNKDNTPVLRDISGVIELTANDPVVNKSFALAPAADAGNGSVLITFNKGDASTIASATARWKDAGGTDKSQNLVAATTIDPGYSSDVLALKLDSVAPAPTKWR